MSIGPESLRRRSFIYRELADLGARFAEVAGCAAAMDFGEREREADAAKTLGVCDLSALRRCGFKGPRTLEWLREKGIHVGEADNMAYAQDEGWLAARLAPGEVLLLGDLDGGGPCEALARAWSMDGEPGTYPVPRAGANVWFLVSGAQAPAMFAKLCGVDLRPHRFTAGEIAQTSIARLNGIVIRDDLGAVPAYHLLADSAAAGYLWSCLLDAMAEFDGRPVGLGAVRRLRRN